MDKKYVPWLIAGGVILVLLLWFVGSYNGLVRADVNVDEKWGQVQTAYQRRAELIPNLVNTVQGAVKFEQETQTQIAALRTQAVSIQSKIQGATTPAELDAAGQELNGVVSRYAGLNINVENYPQLRATENFLSLQDELAGTENRVAVERKRFNEAVGDYNKRIRTFPRNIVASMFGFEKRDFFESSPGADQAPVVDFS